MKYLNLIFAFLLAFCSCYNLKNDFGKNAEIPVLTDENEVLEQKLEVEIIVERGAFYYGIVHE